MFTSEVKAGDGDCGGASYEPAEDRLALAFGGGMSLGDSSFLRHPLAEAPRLCKAIRAQMDGGRPSGEEAADIIVRGVAHQVEDSRHSAAPSMGSSAPAMKSSVRWRASASVNWRGGDFMK